MGDALIIASLFSHNSQQEHSQPQSHHDCDSTNILQALTPKDAKEAKVFLHFAVVHT
jgi:hypothetical protein